MKKEKLTAIDEYIEINQTIEEKVQNNHGEDEIMKLCEEGFENLPEFLKEWKIEYGELPNYIPYRDYLIQIYIKKAKFEELSVVIEKLNHLNAWRNEMQKIEKNKEIEKLKEIFIFIEEEIKKSPGMSQEQLLSLSRPEDREFFEWALNNHIKLKKANIEGQERHWLVEQKKELEAEKRVSIKAFQFDNSSFKFTDKWFIAAVFTYNRSGRYKYVLDAKDKADGYQEAKTKDGKPLHKLVYTKENVHEFIEVYEVIKNWKSTTFIIKGELAPKTKVEETIHCYAAKILSGNKKYCSGVKSTHKNPFGCHKLGLNIGEEPWWIFGHFDSKDVWHVDKELIKEKLNEKREKLMFCPAFNWKQVVKALDEIPNEIDTNKDEKWIRSGYTLQPKT